MNPGTLAIRADAGVAMGTGHAMRCLALAQAWRQTGGNALFAMAESTPAITRRLYEERIEVVRFQCPPGGVEDANGFEALADECGVTWVAVDGYQFDSSYQRTIKNSGCRLLWVDDNGHCTPYCADFVLNQNIYAHAGMYSSCCFDTNLLLGPRHALLREEFLPWRRWQRDFAPVAKHVLVAMGGSDPQNATAQVLNLLRQSDLNIGVTVVIGGSNQHAESLREIVRESPAKFRLQTEVKDMAGLMGGADLAISAAGSSCYEFALLQVPMILIALAENQGPTAQSLSEAGAALSAGCFKNLDCKRLIETVRHLIPDCALRRSLAQGARQLVDGNGAHRVCESLLRHKDSHHKTRLKVQVGTL